MMALPMICLSLGIEEASHRSTSSWKKSLEFLYASSSGGDKRVFDKLFWIYMSLLDKAAPGVSSYEHPESTMVGQVDALTDLLYLTYGSFVLRGWILSLLDTVHEANMRVKFPDGKAHFGSSDYKILKPGDQERFAPEPHIKTRVGSSIQKSIQRNK